MAAGDAGAARTSRRTMLDLLMNPKYGVHRFAVLCLVVVLVAVIIWAVLANRQAVLEGLPGVAHVDGTAHEIELGSEATADQVQEVLRNTRNLDEEWTLVIGSARLTTRTAVGDQATDDTAAIELLRRLGVVRLTAPAMIIIDPYGTSAKIELGDSGQLVPFSRALATELAAGPALDTDRLVVGRLPSVTLQRAALARPAEAADFLGQLERVTPLRRVVLGEEDQVQLRASDAAQADRTCALARETLGKRADLDLTVRITLSEDGDGDGGLTRPC